MDNPEATNLLLKNKYGLHKSEEVEKAARQTERIRGEKVPQNPAVRIQNYLDRIQNVINPLSLEAHPNFNRKERNINILKSSLYQKSIIRPTQIPESYFEHQRVIAREQGLGDIEITPDPASWHALAYNAIQFFRQYFFLPSFPIF